MLHAASALFESAPAPESGAPWVPASPGMGPWGAVGCRLRREEGTVPAREHMPRRDYLDAPGEWPAGKDMGANEG